VEFDVFIPARLASTRLPNKPLIKVAGKTLIEWVAEAALASGAQRVVVATDDQRIADAVKACAETVITKAEHPSGTDRIAEAVQVLGLSPDRIIVNLQGDEPSMPPELIREVAQILDENKNAEMATACHRIAEERERDDPNVVKVVFADDGRALYFSRSPIPYQRGDGEAAPLYRHIGLYAYRVGFLNRFVRWPVCSIEASERLEQLRALHNGATIMVAVADQPLRSGIDTPEDLRRFEKYITQ